MTDQLSASVLPLYGGTGVPTPHLDALAKRGVTFDNMVSTCPVCTPFRSMWMTGRHPQSTGHVVNNVRTRHDETSWADVFNDAGYDTGYVGKWHLYADAPTDENSPSVPPGRDRLGFRWWRGYNIHAQFCDGPYDLGDSGETANWHGYETDALTGLAFEYLDTGRDENKPFCLMVNPHQPHLGSGHKPGFMAPDQYYDALPDDLPLPACLDKEARQKFEKAYRNYYAMILAVDDMIGELVKGLDDRGLLDSTILAVSSDHGTHLATHPAENCNPFWTKKMPWETNVHVPLVLHWPGNFDDGTRCDTLIAPVDLLPTFCGLCDIPIPATVEGMDLSRAWCAHEDATEQDALYMMNFTYRFLNCEDGWEWRGVRTKTHTYARFLSGEIFLHDNRIDPWQQRNLAENESSRELLARSEQTLQTLMKARNDSLCPGSSFRSWLDDERRIVRNAAGPLPTPGYDIGSRVEESI